MPATFDKHHYMSKRAKVKIAHAQTELQNKQPVRNYLKSKLALFYGKQVEKRANIKYFRNLTTNGMKRYAHAYQGS